MSNATLNRELKMAETAKLNKETKYYPLVFLLTGMAGGIVVVIIQALFK